MKSSKLNKALNVLKKDSKNFDDNNKVCFGSLPTDSYLLTRTNEIKSSNEIKEQRQDDSSGFCLLINAKKNKKKFVRFADSLGLDLVSVKLIKENHNDETPTSVVKPTLNQKQYLVLIPCFTLSKYFYNNENCQQNCKLIDYLFDNEEKILKFLIRVKNIAYEKSVFIRFTFNNWKTFKDVDASYTPLTNLKQVKVSTAIQTNSPSTFNYFNCVLVINDYLVEEEAKQFCVDTDGLFKIEFAVCYKDSADSEYWDNNHGNNYIFQCLYPKTTH